MVGGGRKEKKRKRNAAGVHFSVVFDGIAKETEANSQLRRRNNSKKLTKGHPLVKEGGGNVPLEEAGVPKQREGMRDAFAGVRRKIGWKLTGKSQLSRGWGSYYRRGLPLGTKKLSVAIKKSSTEAIERNGGGENTEGKKEPNPLTKSQKQRWLLLIREVTRV